MSGMDGIRLDDDLNDIVIYGCYWDSSKPKGIRSWIRRQVRQTKDEMDETLTALSKIFD